MNDILKLAYDEYSANGFILQQTAKYTKFSNKKGSYQERENEPFTDSATGYAAIIPPNIICVDSDDYEKGCMFDTFCKDLGYTPEPSVITPSGGKHYFFENPYPEKIVGKHIYDKVDIYAGYQSVVPIVGTVVKNKQGKLNSYKWADDVIEGLILNKFDNRLLDMLNMRDRGEKTAKEYSDLDLALKTEEMPLKEVLELLYSMPENLDYDSWLEVGMALYDRFGGSDEGFKYFNEFSEKSTEKYDEDFTYKKWYSGALVPDTLTYKKLRYIANDIKIANIDKDLESIKTLKDIISYGESFSKVYLEDETRSKVIDKLCVKSKEITGKPNRVDIKKAVSYKSESLNTIDAANVDWLDNIIYVESFTNNKFYLLDTDEKLSSYGVEGRFAKELDELRKQMSMKTLSIQTLVKRGKIKICSNHEYNPLTDEKVFRNQKGALILNLYDVKTRPPVADNYTEKGKELIYKLVKHLHLLMQEEEAEILLQWLAYSAQNVGKKILWTPLIESAEGLGKSLIGNIMIYHVFGTNNAGTVASNVVTSPQTSWATKGVFKVLEEIKLEGHNRYEVLNILKPFITNKTVSRVEKFEASSEVVNFVNFIAFTNFKDAVPLNDADRRWWIVFSRQDSIETLENEVAMTREEYYKPLIYLADEECQYGKEFHKYLLEYDISSFNPNYPPKSIHKERLRATEDSKTNKLSEIKDIISQGSKGVTEEVLSSRLLKDTINMSEDSELTSITDAELVTILRKLGYIKFPKRIKKDGISHHVWFKSASLSDNQVKDLFTRALKLDIDNGFENIEDEF